MAAHKLLKRVLIAIEPTGEQVGALRSAFPEITFETPNDGALVERVASADALLSDFSKVDELIANGPHLRWVQEVAGSSPAGRTKKAHNHAVFADSPIQIHQIYPLRCTSVAPPQRFSVSRWELGIESVFLFLSKAVSKASKVRLA